jgi:hypothetical protein
MRMIVPPPSGCAVWFVYNAWLQVFDSGGLRGLCLGMLGMQLTCRTRGLLR